MICCACKVEIQDVEAARKTYRCKPCVSAMRREHYQANKERIKARVRAHYKANKPASAEYHKKYYLEHKDQVRALHAEWVLKNKERDADHKRQWVARNLDRRRDQVRIYQSKRRSKIKHSGDRFTADQLAQRFSVFGDKCVYCGVGGKMTMDHVIPMSRGGRHILSNIRPACLSCNCRKQARKPSEWKP